MTGIDWNKRTELLDAIAEAALTDAKAVEMVGIARIGIELDARHTEAASKCSEVVRDYYLEQVNNMADRIHGERFTELTALGIAWYDLRDAIDEAYLNEARGISYE